jgi:hypothetical protein
MQDGHPKDANDDVFLFNKVITTPPTGYNAFVKRRMSIKYSRKISQILQNNLQKREEQKANIMESLSFDISGQKALLQSQSASRKNLNEQIKSPRISTASSGIRLEHRFHLHNEECERTFSKRRSSAQMQPSDSMTSFFKKPNSGGLSTPKASETFYSDIQHLKLPFRQEIKSNNDPYNSGSFLNTGKSNPTTPKKPTLADRFKRKDNLFKLNTSPRLQHHYPSHQAKKEGLPSANPDLTNTNLINTSRFNLADKQNAQELGKGYIKTTLRHSETEEVVSIIRPKSKIRNIEVEALKYGYSQHYKKPSDNSMFPYATYNSGNANWTLKR